MRKMRGMILAGALALCGACGAMPPDGAGYTSFLASSGNCVPRPFLHFGACP